jgi:hypothetical protein
MNYLFDIKKEKRGCIGTFTPSLELRGMYLMHRYICKDWGINAKIANLIIREAKE